VSRPACAAAAQRAGIGERHQDLLNAITFACMAALGRPCRRKLHAQSFGINKPSLGTSPNSKSLPRRHIEAVLDRRSHHLQSSETVGEVLRDQDEIVLHPDVQAGSAAAGAG
jgi:hypothetical protein